jgi:hypothetical protein
LSSTRSANHHRHQPRRRSGQVNDTIEFPGGTGSTAPSRRASELRPTKCASRAETVISSGQPVLNPC